MLYADVRSHCLKPDNSPRSPIVVGETSYMLTDSREFDLNTSCIECLTDSAPGNDGEHKQ